jgi:N-acetyl-gamma-glutamyl-phosphate reductase
MGSLSNYKLNGTHQHIPEIEQSLADINGNNLSVSFNPILAPMPRGILANCISILKKPLKVSEVAQIFNDYYSGQTFVKVVQNSNLQTSSVIDTNDCHLQISIDENTNQITVVSVLDNLIKGVSIEEYIGTLTSAKHFRKFQLEHTFTHYILLPKFPKK